MFTQSEANMFTQFLTNLILWLVERILFLPPGWLETHFPVNEYVDSRLEKYSTP
jgi:hypothetical protein